MQQDVIFRDLGVSEYSAAWDYQEKLLQQNVALKSAARESGSTEAPPTKHYLLFTEHPAVFTLGKSGLKEHVLLNDEQLADKHIAFFHTNRGGDITFHGPEQLVGYPVFDLEKFTTDIGKYLRNLEEAVILTLAEYGITGERSAGETGVWLDPHLPGKARKICAIGVRCSRWITMHGFALNVNTDLSYFNYIIPCGIPDKQVTSLQKELGHAVPMEEIKQKVRKNFERVFDVRMIRENTASFS
jgi:lipoyl(octanoyl) transferase